MLHINIVLKGFTTVLSRMFGCRLILKQETQLSRRGRACFMSLNTCILLNHSGSLKVIRKGKGVCKSSLVFHCNSILYRFLDIQRQITA